MGCGIPPNKVARLVKSIYGLHQSGKIWWDTLSKVLRNVGFVHTDAEPCLWIYRHSGVEIYLLMHVDDGLVITNNGAKCKEILSKVSEKHLLTVNPEPADWYVGIMLDQKIDSRGILNSCTLSQPAYVKQLCKQHGIDPESSTGTVGTPCTQNKMSIDDAPKIITRDVSEQQKKFISWISTLSCSLHHAWHRLCSWPFGQICL